VRLSSQDKGPLLARDFLREQGIALIIEPHLPRTHLDGAAILYRQGGNPVIGLTIRYDRLDNFWFCLMHELAHVALHLDGESHFYDDLDLEEQNEFREQEADQLARETMIPERVWKTSPASTLQSPDAADLLARKLEISPAIVAGRMRYEFKAYRLLKNMVGHGEVRRLFPEVEWERN
jgi:HTH-type transcriptional regulator/antitoxin HigA